MKVGLTGGIGSGKTSVCKVFGVLGIPLFDADTVARQIIETVPSVRVALNEIAGQDLFLSGSLDRRALASLIFSNTALLEKVNALIHPLVFEEFLRWAGERDEVYVIMEAAILFESGADAIVDRTIAVAAPYEERIERVIGRSGLTRSEVEERMRNQYPQEVLIQRADYVIYNGEDDMVIPAVLEIHRKLISKPE